MLTAQKTKGEWIQEEAILEGDNIVDVVNKKPCKLNAFRVFY